MGPIRVLAIVGVVLMAGAIVFGLVNGDFRGEGAEIIAFAWGTVTLIDLYVGLAIFGAWVVVREHSWSQIVVWWILLIVLGNLTAAVYLALAAFRSRDIDELLSGRVR